jgi:RNA recognition motif-containing protein
MAELYLSNVPFDCKESELQHWIESRGFIVDSIRLIPDLVAGVSPGFAYVQLRNPAECANAIVILNGKDLRGRVLKVQENWQIVKASSAA